MTLIIKADSAMTAPRPDTPIITAPVAADTFNRPDGPLGNTEVGDLAWTQHTGTIEVVDGAAQATSASGATGSLWTIDTAITTGSVHATALTGDAYVAVRGTAGGDAYLFGRSAGQGEYRLQKRESGAVTILASTAAPSSSSPERYSVDLLPGGQMVCKVNGVTLLDHADTAITGTRVGLRFFSSGSRADDFAVFA